MSKETMPAAEAQSYELAFHVLPTVAEGEVATVFQKLKDTITKAGGTLTTEEAPARFDLAYDIVKYLEGRNRKFTSAYFGWVRFTAEAATIEKITAEIEGTSELLRYLLTKLTKIEEEHPFFFHEALNEQKIEHIDVDEIKAAKEAETAAKADDKKVETARDGEEKSDEV